jgi:exosome complex RNA-binding protein Rrp4
LFLLIFRNFKKNKKRYIGDIGDVVVGRITAVESNRWRVDINSTLDAMLPLTSVNLPGGELVIILFKYQRVMYHNISK